MCFGPNGTTPPTDAFVMTDSTEPVIIRATLAPRGPAAAVILTDAQVAAIGEGAKTPPVRVTVNGGYTFAGRIGRMGGESLLGFNKAVRAAAGVEAGDEIEIAVVLDEGPREVDVPADLAAALDADPATRAAFEALAYTRRNEYARAVADAKRPETRERRINQTVAELLGNG